ncbi:MAG TPA: ATP-binding protein, partial [Pirellulales bacterium]|nr:ATP-binding protein [Pirellulales bacterium]
IMNALQIMQQDQTGRAVIQQARSVIERQVRQMTRLIDDLLDVTRITRGKVQLRKEQVELSGVVQRAVETVKPMIEARQHTLTVSLPDEPIWLDADPARLEQIVSNLLANAAKYTEPGGRIWLSAMCQNQRAVISVRDEGVGIAPELLPHIFDLFTQAERTLDQSQGGLGVGLTLVKSLLELHGGTISARSDGPGKGSEFVVELPTTPLPKVTPPKVTRSSEPIAAAALRVLVVDDNLDTADSLAMLLLLKGYDVTTANDGIKAVEVAMAFLPDVVLLDIGLPGADGNEVARRIRQQKELEGVVLVAMTGYGQDSDRQRSHAAGFDYHLVKPADPVKVQQLLAMLSPRA